MYASSLLTSHDLMYKTADSKTGKCRFKLIQSNFKAKLKDKSFNCVH